MFFSDASVHVHNFESISAAEKDTHKTMVFKYVNMMCTFLIFAQSLTHIIYININEAHTLI